MSVGVSRRGGLLGRGRAARGRSRSGSRARASATRQVAQRRSGVAGVEVAGQHAVVDACLAGVRSDVRRRLESQRRGADADGVEDQPQQGRHRRSRSAPSRSSRGSKSRRVSTTCPTDDDQHEEPTARAHQARRSSAAHRTSPRRCAGSGPARRRPRPVRLAEVVLAEAGLAVELQQPADRRPVDVGGVQHPQRELRGGLPRLARPAPPRSACSSNRCQHATIALRGSPSRRSRSCSSASSAMARRTAPAAGRRGSRSRRSPAPRATPRRQAVCRPGVRSEVGDEHHPGEGSTAGSAPPTTLSDAPRSAASSPCSTSSRSCSATCRWARRSSRGGRLPADLRAGAGEDLRRGRSGRPTPTSVTSRQAPATASDGDDGAASSWRATLARDRAATWSGHDRRLRPPRDGAAGICGVQ